MPKWHKDLIHKFITKYVESEILWNNQHPGWRHGEARNNVYLELQKIVNDPNFTLDDVRRKIKGFRTTYCIELKKIEESDGKYQPSLSWFHIMDNKLHDTALQNMVRVQNQSTINRPKRIRKARVSKQLYNSHEIFQLRSRFADSEIVKTEIVASDQSSCNDDEENSAEYDPLSHYDEDIQTDEVTSHSTLAKSKKSQSQVQSSTSVVADTSSSTLTPQNTEEDEFDIFGKSIAIQLRKMSLIQSLKLQLEIQTLLMNARLKMSTDKT